jgi:hypothetical protein
VKYVQDGGEHIKTSEDRMRLFLAALALIARVRHGRPNSWIAAWAGVPRNADASET